MIYTRDYSNPDGIPRNIPTFEPCPVCGAIEKEVAEGVYKIFHRYEAHGLQRLAEYEKSA